MPYRTTLGRKPAHGLSARAASRLSWDVIIIGAGHNGLTAAAYLARAGKRVLVLERRDRIGGACTLEELRPGHPVSPCAYLCGLLHPRVIGELNLPGYGYHWTPAEEGLFVPLPHGGYIRLPEDPEACENEIRRVAPGDLEGWRAYQELFNTCRQCLRPEGDEDIWIGTAPDRETIAQRLGHRQDAVSLMFEDSMAGLLDHFFESEALKIALMGQGVIGTRASPFCPGTAYVHFHHSSGTMHGRRGTWGYVRGGMGRVSFILGDIAEHSGAVILPGVSVQALDPGIGVVDTEGRNFRAPVVISNADPRRTLGFLGDYPAPSWREAVERQPIEGCTLKVNVVLDALPDFKALPGSPMPHHRGQVNLPLTREQWKQAFDAHLKGCLPDALWCELYFQSAVDPVAFQDGRHSMSMFCQYVPYRFADGRSWDHHRDAARDLALQALAQVCGNIPDAVVDVDTMGPPDIESKIGLTGGHIFQGDILPDYMWERRLQAVTPVPGLYLCGAGTHPGGSVIGINGRNAAMAVLGRD